MSAQDIERIPAISAALEGLITALTRHSLWVPPNPNKSLYHVWDFVKRSQYMLSEVESIKYGKKLQHPDQFRPSPGTGEAAAKKVFNDVCQRTAMVNMLMTGPPSMVAMMTGGTEIQYGDECLAKLEELKRVTA